jgi:hypothetical protein
MQLRVYLNYKQNNLSLLACNTTLTWLICLQSIASATLYLASKVHDETVKLRDLINVTYHTLHRDAAPIRLAEDYWNFRDSIVHAEMLTMRLLQFDTTFDHPHNVIKLFIFKNIFVIMCLLFQQYFLHYVQTVRPVFYSKHGKDIIVFKKAYDFLHVCISFSLFH